MLSFVVFRRVPHLNKPISTQQRTFNNTMPLSLFVGQIEPYLSSSCSGYGSKQVLQVDQGYGRGGTPFLTGVFEPLARVALYPTDEDGLGTWFGAA